LSACVTNAALALAILSGVARAQTTRSDPPSIVVADFDYVDTSGEPRDQQVQHAARLQAFAGAVRAELAQSGKYRVTPCTSTPCSAGQGDPSTLIADARKSGARLVLYGGIHKMSTLIQFAKVQMLDIENDRLVFDRLISFRGDTDEAWQHAQRFLVRELLQ
jgi:hypothetical protein